MTTNTLDQRVASLPDYQQKAFLTFLEYLEWKAQLPSNKPNRVTFNRELGERLRTVRATLNQTKEAAAITAGVANTTYQQYELGIIGRWDTAKMQGYCETWNVSFDWLLDGSGTMFMGDKPPQIEPSPEPTEEKPAARGPRGPYGKDRPAGRRAAAAAPASNVVRFAPRGKS